MLFTSRPRRLWLMAAVAATTLATVLVAGGSASAGPGTSSSGDVPYVLGGALPAAVQSPAVDPAAPYTALVKSLIHQLEPDSPPTAAELQNAAKLFQGLISFFPGTPSNCNGIGAVLAPTGTMPSISPLCWADAVGVNLIKGPNVGKTTATPEPLALGASFDRQLSNAWGQLEGAEGRRLMVTGLYGPEADVSVQPNWERGLDTLGEDPFVNGQLAASQVSGMQGRGLMSQLKHFAAFSGANRNMLTQVGDQALHEMLLAPFENPVKQANAASLMCAYEEYQDTSKYLPGTQNALYPASPYASRADASTKTWPLDERHWACEQPLALNYVLRWMWHSNAFIGSDYPSIHSTPAIVQGAAQEFFSPYFFGSTDPATQAQFNNIALTDPTGDTCVQGQTATPEPCSAADARHIGGIAGKGCDPTNGCGLVTGVLTGNLPLAVFNQALAELLYQEQRFGLLGCDQTPIASTCTNPGGLNGDRSGNASLPAGPDSGATAAADLGSKNGDAAVVELAAEEGAVLLKDNNSALPLTTGVLRRGVAVSGAGAEYLIAAPSDEAATGFADRNAISPLRQLQAFAPAGSKLSFSPANDPTGYVVPTSELSTRVGTVTGGLSRTAGPGSPATDKQLDFTTASQQGQLAAGDYTWTGYVYAPRKDSYTFRFQYTPGTTTSPTLPVTFAVDGQNQALSAASSFYCGQYFPSNPVCVPVGTTNEGYTQGGLTNQQSPQLALTKGYHKVSITFRDDTASPASFRFAYSRVNGDALDAAAAARGKAAAVVFVNDNGVQVIDQDANTPSTRGVATLLPAQVRLIDAVSKANPNTIVVMNTADPVIVQPWVNNVRAVLEMWNAGSEGGTANARLLLGQANPSGHTTITWPKQANDTLWTYNQTKPLYPGDSTGTHPERLNGLADNRAADCASFNPPVTPCTKTQLTEGIYSGYRYYDKEQLQPQYPFGYGLSYTQFRYEDLSLTRTGGGVDATFKVTNVGTRSGTTVAQAYVAAGHPVPGVQQAVRSLRGFTRITLRPGQMRTVTIRLDPQSFQYWNQKQQRWTTLTGARTVLVGDADSPSHLPLQGDVQISA